MKVRFLLAIQVQSGASVAFGIVALLMYQCVLYPTPIQMVDPTQVPTVLTSFSNSFYLQYFHCEWLLFIYFKKNSLIIIC